MQREKVLFVILVFVSVLGSLTTDLYLPALPTISVSLNTSIPAIQFTIAIYMLGFTASPLIYGPLSDGVGRRKPLLAGVALCMLGSVICIFATNIEFFLAGRLLQGVGAGAGSSLFRPILRDLFSAHKLAVYGSYSSLISVGALAFAPLLGGYLVTYFGWQAIFIFLFSYTCLAFITVTCILPETNAHRHRENLQFKKIYQNFHTLITNRIFLAYSLLSFLSYASILSWLTAGPIILEKVSGLTPVGFGWAYTLTGGAFALGAIINSRYVTRIGIPRMLRFGIFCQLAAGLLMFVLGFADASHPAITIVPAILVLFSAPFIFPNSFAGAFQPFPQIAGSVGALFSTISALGGVLTSSLMALTPDTSQIPMALTIVACALLAGIIFYTIIAKSPS